MKNILKHIAFAALGVVIALFYFAKFDSIIFALLVGGGAYLFCADHFCESADA